ncbi:MAG: hypothetical protein LUC93_05920 [Planctomycetaceae bacterium]|nr:hypothetical protein [Planctomycetaceae bacterium]
MAKKRTYSRLSPRYLSSRYAGVFFMLMALGVLAGTAYRALVQPTRYAARAEVGVMVDPPEAATDFDWNAALAKWRVQLHDRRDWGLLTVNLRHVLKLAVTQDMLIDTETFGSVLSAFNPSVTFSTVLYSGRIAGWFSPMLEVSRSDLAGNMDFQSLAVIASDLDPPHGVQGWDFTAFRSAGVHAASAIVNPGPDDRYFSVFYQLHRLLNGGDAPTPMAAYATAVSEVAARLEREASFAGGGGFGHQAKRELMREIAAIPALAANSLYLTGGWPGGNGDHLPGLWGKFWSEQTTIDLKPTGGSAGAVTAVMYQDLHPLAFPRDTVATRIAPVAVATLLATLAAREEIAPAPAAPAPVAQVATVQPDSGTTPVVAAPAPAVPEKIYREVIDDIANKQRLSHIAMVEEALRLVRVEREASLRRLHTSRENENRLSYEAVNARNRADRLRERYDEAVQLLENDTAEPYVPEETAELFARRDALLRRLAELLEYCTEEHPFVREVRREMAALDVLLGSHSPDAERNRQAEARATRLANLYLEWETSVEQAESLEERARRQADAVSCLLDEVTAIERSVTERETELIKAKEVPVPILRIEVPSEPAEPTPPPPPPEPVIQPSPEPAPEPEPARPAARLAFSAIPTHIPLERTAPSWLPILCGLLGGFCLGLVWLVLREIFGRRFRSVGEAHRLIKMPVLAALPAYDPKSLRAAAATMKGELIRTRAGKMQFMPAPVELSEPPPLAKRGKVQPARKRLQWGRWLAGLVCLILAGILYTTATGGGFLQPRDIPGDELPLPAAALSNWAEEDEVEEWGDLP